MNDLPQTYRSEKGLFAAHDETGVNPIAPSVLLLKQMLFTKKLISYWIGKRYRFQSLLLVEYFIVQKQTH